MSELLPILDDRYANVAIAAAAGDYVWAPRARSSFATHVGHNYDVVTYDQMLSLWESLRAAYPAWITRSACGNDQSDTYPIYKYVFTPETGFDRTVIVDAGIHGPEVMAQLCAYLFFLEVAETWRTDAMMSTARNRVRWVVVPVLNPYGLNAKTRKNSRGVDINRNFAHRWATSENGSTDPESPNYKGLTPVSEAEAAILVALVAEYSTAVAGVSLHDYGAPTGTADCAIFFPEFCHPRNNVEIQARLRRMAYHQGLTLAVNMGDGPAAYSMYAAAGMLSCNPEWAFNHVSPTYGAADVTSALAYYGNVLLAHALSDPGASASDNGVRLHRLRFNFTRYVDGGSSLSTFVEMGPAYVIDTSDMMSGLMRVDQTLYVRNALTEKLLINPQLKFGMDGACRQNFNFSGGATSSLTRLTLQPGEYVTLFTSASGFFASSPSQRVRYTPRVACRNESSTPVSGALEILGLEACIWLYPTDAAPAMSLVRLNAADATEWVDDPNFV